MGVLERSEIVIIERLESASPIRVVSWIGRRMDLNSTAVGKALIAHLPDAEFDAQVRPSQLARHNDRTIGSMAALRKELDRVRQLGYSVCDEEDEIGVRCVGAPILDTRRGMRSPPSASPAPRCRFRRSGWPSSARPSRTRRPRSARAFSARRDRQLQIAD